MKRAPEINGKVLCDLHAHPTHKASLDEIVKAVSTPGLVGLTVKDIDKSGKDILRYEQALDWLEGEPLTEIDNGQLAKCRDGYFARTQEIQVGMHHLLIIGWEGRNYFPNYETIDEAMKEINACKGMGILTHPFALIAGQQIRLPNSPEEEELIRKAYSAVDEVETYNGHCLDIIPGLLAMNKANALAENLRQNEFPHHTGTAGSDCHRRWEQVKVVGIYIDQKVIETAGTVGLKTAIAKGNFTRFGDSSAGPYISRWSWMRGIGGDYFSLLT